MKSAPSRGVVAMSGGVDSSVVAALLAREGHDVIGITLQLYDQGTRRAGGRSCCAGQDVYDARRVARRLGIRHYVLDYESRFRREVIQDFADSYARGETPVPCIRCNQRVKFRDLLGTARELGADWLATGHYVRRLEGQKGVELHCGADPARDQSYFLFTTTREQLAFLRFPLGGIPKSETRTLAETLDLPVARKPDSQDICFVPRGHHQDMVRRLRPDAATPGRILHQDGRILGQHKGIGGLTVGQRRGLGVADGAPLYVTRIEPESRRVVVAPADRRGVSRFTVRDLNWLDGQTPDRDDGLEATVRIRSMHPGAGGRVRSLGNRRAEIRLHRPETAVAPGQAAVLYRGSRVLGGGWIEPQERWASH